MLTAGQRHDIALIRLQLHHMLTQRGAVPDAFRDSRTYDAHLLKRAFSRMFYQQNEAVSSTVFGRYMGFLSFVATVLSGYMKCQQNLTTAKIRCVSLIC